MTKLVSFILANIQWDGVVARAISHLYHVGSRESLRNVMEGALLIQRGYEAPLPWDETPAAVQLSF